MRNFSLWPESVSSFRVTRTAMPLALLLLIGTLSTIPAGAITHPSNSHHARKVRARGIYRFRMAKWRPVFAGSHELLVQQNIELDRLQLPRIADDDELIKYEQSEELVPVSESDALKIAPDLPDNRRYCRPWTREFLEDFSQAFYTEFHIPLQVNSLVRTVQQQHKLRRHNRYAAPEIGDTASTHLTGVTADLSRRGLTKAQYQWIRDYLMPLHEAGLVDPIEERQPVLHVVVYEKYSAQDSDAAGMSEASEPGEFTLTGSSYTIQP
jgi:hypothetical protein